MNRTIWIAGCLIAGMIATAIFNAFNLDGFYFLLPLLPISIFFAIAAWCWAHFKYETQECGTNCTKCCARCPCREELDNEIEILDVETWQGDQQRNCSTCKFKDKCDNKR